MQDVNLISLIGRLSRDVEMRYTPSGTAVANFTLANSGRNDTTNWIDCVAWNKAAEILAEYGTKGKQLAVTGRLQTRSWEAEDGSKRKSVEVVVDTFQLLGSKGGHDEGQKTHDDTGREQGTINPDEIPLDPPF